MDPNPSRHLLKLLIASISGICLPRNILDLFPPKTHMGGTYVSRCVQEWDLIDLSSTMKVTDECEESSVSSLSDISSVNGRRSKLGAANKHNRSLCLLCCRNASARDFRLHSSNQGGLTETDAVADLTASSAITPQRRKTSRSSLIPTTSDISFNSPESLMSEDSKLQNDSLSSQIMRHVQRISNPVWAKQSKMALFKLKQKHPTVFQDICIYSEVCRALSQNSYRLAARRFLQELFMDLNYGIFYKEAMDIVSAHEDDVSIQSDSDVVDGDMNGLGASSTSSSEKPRTTPRSPPEPRVLTTVPPILVTYPLKSHLLKSSLLASVYETSRENLSESLGNTSKLTNNHSINSNATCHSFGNQNDAMSSLSNASITLTTTTAIINHQSSSNVPSGNVAANQRRYSRPRFNTLELDLSCTRNKFPITERRRTSLDTSNASITNSVDLKEQRILKSLSASITPTLTLFCEKRLKSSQSEATLSNKSEQNHRTETNSVGNEKPSSETNCHQTIPTN